MLKSAFFIGAFVSVLGWSSTTCAESRTLVIEGDLTQQDLAFEGLLMGAQMSEPERIARFRARLTYDDAVLWYRTFPNPSTLNTLFESNSTLGRTYQSIEFDFLDASGALIAQPNIKMRPHIDAPLYQGVLELSREEDTQTDTPSREALILEYDYRLGEFSGFPLMDGFGYQLGPRNCVTLPEGLDYCAEYIIDLYIEADDETMPVMFQHEYGVRLEPNDYRGTANFSLGFRVREWRHEMQTIMFNSVGFNVVADSIYYFSDSDNDGIVDDEDSCDASVVGGTISFGNLNTGIANTLMNNGCSAMDLYQACWDGQQSIYGGPTYCEMQVPYQLYAQQALTYPETRQLRQALYDYYRSLR